MKQPDLVAEPEVPAEDDPPMHPMGDSSAQAAEMAENSTNPNIDLPKRDARLSETSSTLNASATVQNKSEAGEEKRKTDVSVPSARKKAKSVRLVMCVLNTKYAVVRHVGKKVFKFRLTKDEEGEWDLCWQDGSVQPEQLARMKPYQKINHFPGMYGISRKDYLGRNLMRMRKTLPDDYNFFPKTWMLPTEWLDFSKQFNGKRTFILKPEASCQGRGIFLTKRLDDVKQDQHYVAQKYLGKPYLIDGLKFDLRIYVLLYGCDPMRIFIYHEGLARFATEEYRRPGQVNLSDVCMHLTNYAINKNSDKFVFNNDANVQDYGHKRNLQSVWKYIDEHEGPGSAEKVRARIEDIVIKTISSIQPSLAHLYRSCVSDDIDNSCCFEVLGFDILLDHKLRPWLLEVNHSPSFSTDTPFDWKIKLDLISDTVTLLNITQKKKKLYLQKRRKEMQQRIFNKPPAGTSLQDEKQRYRDKKFRIRSKFELSHLGGFKLIYPTETSEEKYKACLDTAKDAYLSFMGCGKKSEPAEPSARSIEKPSSTERPLFIKTGEPGTTKGNSKILPRKSSCHERPHRPSTVRVGSRRTIVDAGKTRLDTSLKDEETAGMQRVTEPRVLVSRHAGPAVSGLRTAPHREVQSQSLFRPAEIKLLGDSNPMANRMQSLTAGNNTAIASTAASLNQVMLQNVQDLKRQIVQSKNYTRMARMTHGKNFAHYDTCTCTHAGYNTSTVAKFTAGRLPEELGKPPQPQPQTQFMLMRQQYRETVVRTTLTPTTKAAGMARRQTGGVSQMFAMPPIKRE